MIGEGAFGRVYKSFIIDSGFYVAEKVFTNCSDLTKRLKVEATVHLKMHGQKSFPIFYGITPTSLVMEYFSDRITLHDFVNSSEALKVSFTAIAMDIMQGINTMHNIGFLHNDIHLNNVMIQPSMGKYLVLAEITVE